MGKIESIRAREILDSRGNPTLEVEVTLDNKARGWAKVPSGASTGRHEACELRDNDDRFGGLGVRKALDNITRVIAPNLVGLCPMSQAEIDHQLIELDGTKDKSNLGANAIVGVSLATACAAANWLQVPLYRYLGGVNASLLPVPLMNIVNGGKHATSSLDFQEFMILPLGDSFFSSLRIGTEVYQSLKKVLKGEGKGTTVGDEGGFAPQFQLATEALEAILKAIETSRYRPGQDVFLALDVAASELYSGDKYSLTQEGKSLTSAELVDYYAELIQKYPIISLEDGMAEDDEEGWKLLAARLGERIQLVGDDLYTTNVERLRQGILKHITNSILIKPNQVGTLSETMEAIEMAAQAGWTTIISHRSGETEDTFIADLAVGMGSGQIKCGAPCRSERVAKYNRLLKIEEELGREARFKGKRALNLRW
jgi:enolase